MDSIKEVMYNTLTFFEAANELMISCVVPCGRQQNAMSQSSMAAADS